MIGGSFVQAALFKNTTVLLWLFQLVVYKMKEKIKTKTETQSAYLV